MGKTLTRISRNLYIQTNGNSRTWIFRYSFQGRTRDLGLGPLSRVTVAKAEALAYELRDKIARGVDPQLERGGHARLLNTIPLCVGVTFRRSWRS